MPVNLPKINAMMMARKTIQVWVIIQYWILRERRMSVIGNITTKYIKMSVMCLVRSFLFSKIFCPMIAIEKNQISTDRVPMFWIYDRWMVGSMSVIIRNAKMLMIVYMVR